MGGMDPILFVTSSFISVLVNGSPTLEFKAQRGLRQGYPLAPFLFNIVVEGLCSMTRQAIEKNIFSSFLVGKSNTHVNLFQYVDDTLFFMKTSLSNVFTIKSMLTSFELISRLKVNFHISFFGAIGLKDNVLEWFATIINFMILNFHLCILALSLC